ncbi:DUF6002 family protein [Micromonospora rifamycinica]|uniref:DUF6002 family protein n=1 Tax=Micromonospora rifamycinica TaxID=291594 RepID=UPI0039A40F1D
MYLPSTDSAWAPGRTREPPSVEIPKGYPHASRERSRPSLPTGISRWTSPRNPGTMTTKPFASLIIVARAVRHIQQTGPPPRLAADLPQHHLRFSGYLATCR